ncbi:MAG: hypothetical protein RM021_003445 [Nostoc sp. EkiNYC01]|nr:hypothetical protein [Nostoc sp. EkiNYC01]
MNLALPKSNKLLVKHNDLSNNPHISLSMEQGLLTDRNEWIA